MKALVKAHAKPGLWLQDVDKPTIGPEDVLIKVNEVHLRYRFAYLQLGSMGPGARASADDGRA